LTRCVPLEGIRREKGGGRERDERREGERRKRERGEGKGRGKSRLGPSVVHRSDGPVSFLSRCVPLGDVREMGGRRREEG
jgi:hypothetical protein